MCLAMTCDPGVFRGGLFYCLAITVKQGVKPLCSEGAASYLNHRQNKYIVFYVYPVYWKQIGNFLQVLGLEVTLFAKISAQIRVICSCTLKRQLFCNYLMAVK